MSLEKALLEGTFVRSGDAIFFLDRERFIDCNDAALKLFGFSNKTEFLARHPGEFAPERQPDGRLSVDVANADIEAAFAHGHALIEWQHQRKDGSLFFSEVMLVPFTLDGRQALTATIRDISRRKRAEQEVARQRDALHQSEKLSALGSLLAGVAHELNNPLAVVLGHATFLKETTGDPKTAARAETIRAAADRCARIVKSFLAMARQKPPERKSVRLANVVRAAVDLTAYGLRSDGVRLSVDVADDLPSVMGDEDQLVQVLMNLIVNANHALQLVGADRRLTVSALRAGTGHVRVAVVDNGPGIEPALRARIFEPFFTTKPVGAGTGLGLSLCHAIASSHDGTLTLESPPEGGAAFLLLLPAAREGGDTQTTDAVTYMKSRGLSVLIVEDEFDIANVIEEAIGAMAKTVDKAATGREGLRMLNLGLYDLVIADLRMPDLDGPSLYRMARSAGRTEPFVFVTGDAFSPHLRKFLSEAGEPFVEKPFDPLHLRAVVANIFDQPPPSALGIDSMGPVAKS